MVDIEKWKQFSFAEQMANIGSEVSRVVVCKERGDQANLEKSTERALEILDMAIISSQSKNRLKELLRLRDILADYGFDLFNFVISGQELNNYFLPFAFLARSGY